YRFSDGQAKRIDKDPGGTTREMTWSPDSRWIAYTRTRDVNNTAIWIANSQSGVTRQVTSGMFSDQSPVFDHKGDFLYYVSNRTFNATYEDFGTTWVYTNANTLMAAPLREDVPSPYLPKSSEENWSEESKKVEHGAESKKEGADAGKEATKPPVKVNI